MENNHTSELKSDSENNHTQRLVFKTKKPLYLRFCLHLSHVEYFLTGKNNFFWF